MNELDRAIRAYRQAQADESAALAALHAAIRKELTERAGERGAQVDVVRRTGYTRERLRQIMKGSDPYVFGRDYHLGEDAPPLEYVREPRPEWEITVGGES